MIGRGHGNLPTSNYNPPSSDCGCVVAVSVLGKIQVIQQSAEPGRSGVLRKRTDKSCVGFLGKTSQQIIKVKFDLPYLNQHTHSTIITPNYIFKVKFDLPYLNQHTHTVIVTPYYIFNLLNQII